MAATANDTQKAINVENSALKTLKIKNNEKAKGLVELEFIDNPQKIIHGFNLSVYSKTGMVQEAAVVTDVRINLFLRFRKDVFKDVDQKSIADTILNKFHYCAKLHSTKDNPTEIVFDLSYLSPTHIKHIFTELLYSINQNSVVCPDFTPDLTLLLKSISFPFEIHAVEEFYNKFIDTGNAKLMQKQEELQKKIDEETNTESRLNLEQSLETIKDAKRKDLENRFETIKEKTKIANQTSPLYTNQSLMLLGLELHGMGLFDQALQCYKNITIVEAADIDPKFFWKAQYLIAEILNSRFIQLKTQSWMQTVTTAATTSSNTAASISAIATAAKDTAGNGTQQKLAEKENADQKTNKDSKTAADSRTSNIESLNNYILRGDITGHAVMMERAKEALNYYVRIGHFTDNQLAIQRAKAIIIKYIKLNTTAEGRLKKILNDEGEDKHKSALVVEQTVHANKIYEELTKSLENKSVSDASIKTAINAVFHEDNLNKLNERNNKYVAKIRTKKATQIRKHNRTNSCPDAGQLRITLTSPKDSDTPTTPNQSSAKNTVQSGKQDTVSGANQSKSPPPRPARPERPNRSFEFTRAQSASVTGPTITTSVSASVSPESSPPASPLPPKPLSVRFRAPSKTGENDATNKSPLNASSVVPAAQSVSTVPTVVTASSVSTAIKSSPISSPPNTPALVPTSPLPALRVDTGATASGGKSPEASPPNSSRGRSSSGAPAKTLLLPPPPPPARKTPTNKGNSNSNSATSSATNSPLTGPRTSIASNTASPSSQTTQGIIQTEPMATFSLPAAAATSSLQSSTASAASSATPAKDATANRGSTNSKSVLSPSHVRTDSSVQTSAIFISGLSGLKAGSIAPPPPPPRRPSSEKDSTKDKTGGSKSPLLSATTNASATTVPAAPIAPTAPEAPIAPTAPAAPLSFSSSNPVKTWNIPKKASGTAMQPGGAALKASSSAATASASAKATPSATQPSSAAVSSSTTATVKSASTSTSTSNNKSAVPEAASFANKKAAIAAMFAKK